MNQIDWKNTKKSTEKEREEISVGGDDYGFTVSLKRKTMSRGYTLLETAVRVNNVLRVCVFLLLLLWYACRMELFHNITSVFSSC